MSNAINNPNLVSNRVMLHDEPDQVHNKLDPFQEEVAICIDCMLQDDARGQTIMYVRESGNLIQKEVAADSIDLHDLNRYEMILFDGGNSSGDTWKHVFFPKQHQHFFVDENLLPRPSASCKLA